MTNGTHIVPGGQGPDRLAAARVEHAVAVKQYECAMRNYVAAINALHIPELMRGTSPAVAGLEPMTEVISIAEQFDGARSERLYIEVMEYRSECLRLSLNMDLAKLADRVSAAAALVARLEGRA